MEVQAVNRYVRASLKKLQVIAKVVRGRRATEAEAILRYIPRKSSKLIRKTLLSAIANAENNHNLSAEDLTVKSALIERGPYFRRFRPASRGSSHPYRKPTSHIRVILATQEKADSSTT